MSEHPTPRGPHQQRAVDQLLADSGFTGDDELRTELLELRSLASTAPLPSEAVRALMAGSPTADTQPLAATQPLTTTAGPSASSRTPTSVLTSVPPDSVAPDTVPVPDSVARRRKKRRAAIAGLAVAVSLAGGATAAVASEGGLPGAFQHLGAAIGSVVSQLNPGPGDAPHPGTPAGTTPEPLPVQEAPQQAPGTVQPQPGPAETAGPAVPATEPRPGVGPSNSSKAPASKEPGKGVISAPPELPVTPPGTDASKLGPSKLDPSKLGPSGVPVPVPSALVPSLPAAKDLPGKP